jgi:hypothetical protein
MAINEEQAKLKLSKSLIVAHLRRGRVLLEVGLFTIAVLQNKKLKRILFDRIELSRYIHGILSLNQRSILYLTP